MARIRKGEREESDSRNSGVRDGTAIAGDEEHADVIGTGATGHGLPTQEHRGRERVHTTSARPRTRLEDAVGVGAAMADGESSWAHAKQGLRATKLANNHTGRKRGGRGSHRGENGG